MRIQQIDPAAKTLKAVKSYGLCMKPCLTFLGSTIHRRCPHLPEAHGSVLGLLVPRSTRAASGTAFGQQAVSPGRCPSAPSGAQWCIEKDDAAHCDQRTRTRGSPALASLTAGEVLPGTRRCLERGPSGLWCAAGTRSR